MTEPTERPVRAKELDEHFEAREALTRLRSCWSVDSTSSPTGSHAG